MPIECFVYFHEIGQPDSFYGDFRRTFHVEPQVGDTLLIDEARLGLMNPKFNSAIVFKRLVLSDSVAIHAEYRPSDNADNILRMLSDKEQHSKEGLGLRSCIKPI